MCRVVIIEDSRTQRLQMERGAREGGADAVIAEERWGFAMSTLATLTQEDLVIADYDVPDRKDQRHDAIQLLIDAAIPFRIVTARITEVPAYLLKYTVSKAVNLGLQVAEIVQDSQRGAKRNGNQTAVQG